MSEQMTFEQAMARLEQIVAALESGRCSLDESLRLFEEGAKLTAFCQTALKTAEQKIVKLTAAEQGEEQTLAIPEDTTQSMGAVLSDF